MFAPSYFAMTKVNRRLPIPAMSSVWQCELRSAIMHLHILIPKSRLFSQKTNISLSRPPADPLLQKEPRPASTSAAAHTRCRQSSELTPLDSTLCHRLVELTSLGQIIPRDVLSRRSAEIQKGRPFVLLGLNLADAIYIDTPSGCLSLDGLWALCIQKKRS